MHVYFDKLHVHIEKHQITCLSKMQYLLQLVQGTRKETLKKYTKTSEKCKSWSLWNRETLGQNMLFLRVCFSFRFSMDFGFLHIFSQKQTKMDWHMKIKSWTGEMGKTLFKSTSVRFKYFVCSHFISIHCDRTPPWFPTTCNMFWYKDFLCCFFRFHFVRISSDFSSGAILPQILSSEFR